MTSLDRYSAVKTLFLLGTTATTFASGGILFTSYMHVPAYLKNTSDEVLLKQWQRMGAAGKASIPPLALIAGGAHLLNSYVTSGQPQSYRFMAAGIMSLAILPFTALSLASTNAEFAAREGKAKNHPSTEFSRLDLRDLIKQWSNRSAIRGAFFLASTLLSYDAMLHLTF